MCLLLLMLRQPLIITLRRSASQSPLPAISAIVINSFAILIILLFFQGPKYFYVVGSEIEHLIYLVISNLLILQNQSYQKLVKLKF